MCQNSPLNGNSFPTSSPCNTKLSKPVFPQQDSEPLWTDTCFDIPLNPVNQTVRMARLLTVFQRKFFSHQNHWSSANFPHSGTVAMAVQRSTLHLELPQAPVTKSFPSITQIVMSATFKRAMSLCPVAAHSILGNTRLPTELYCQSRRFASLSF